jgi:hypothetical protein
MSIKIRLANCSGPSRATSVAPRTDALQVTDRGTLSETGRNPGGAVGVAHHEGELTVDDLVSEVDQAAGGGKNRVGFLHQLLGQRSSHDLLVCAVHDRTRFTVSDLRPARSFGPVNDIAHPDHERRHG